MGNNRIAPLYRNITKRRFYMSPREVSHTHVAKSEWTHKQKVGASFKVSALKHISIANV